MNPLSRCKGKEGIVLDEVGGKYLQMEEFMHNTVYSEVKLWSSRNSDVISWDEIESWQTPIETYERRVWMQ